jgi:farnesyl diphosphate synthase
MHLSLPSCCVHACIVVAWTRTFILVALLLLPSTIKISKHTIPYMFDRLNQNSKTMSSSSVGIPVAVGAIALYFLSDQLDGVTQSYFAMTVVEQTSVLVVIFAVIFAAVAASQQQGKATPANIHQAKVNTQRKYPLTEIAAASSDTEKFKCLFPVLRRELLESMSTKNEMSEEAVQMAATMMDYNVPGGKLNRGTTVLAVLRALKGPGQELTNIETARAACAGWAIEFLQAFFLVADDVMDDSGTRRGQPCWYKLPNIQMIAINDSFLLESFCLEILKTHFGHEAYYADLLELVLNVIQKTEFGQLLDLTSQPLDVTTGGSAMDLGRFTLERYRKIVKYKTAFYSFYLPVAMGMLMAGIRETSAFTLARKICCIMGEYFQIQDDYLDCFGDPEVIGKVGTDIQDNKCSWLVVQALQRCTPAQREVLEQNYGQWDDKKVLKVKELYHKLDLVTVFEEYEQASYKDIQAELDKVTLMPRDVFELLLKKIYKRSK